METADGRVVLCARDQGLALGFRELGARGPSAIEQIGVEQLGIGSHV
jgi:hypothetical protein